MGVRILKVSSGYVLSEVTEDHHETNGTDVCFHCTTSTGCLKTWLCLMFNQFVLQAKFSPPEGQYITWLTIAVIKF